MGLHNDKHLDSVGWRLLRLLQENARLSFRQLGDVIGLTSPAVTERVHRLQDAGVIKGFYAELDLAKVGLPIMAFVHLASDSTQSMRFRKAAPIIPEIIECYCVTGSESYIVKVAVTSVPHLEDLLMSLKDFGEVRTSVVLSATVTRRIIDGPPDR